MEELEKSAYDIIDEWWENFKQKNMEKWENSTRTCQYCGRKFRNLKQVLKHEARCLRKLKTV